MAVLSDVQIRHEERVLLDEGEAQLGLAAHQIKRVQEKGSDPFCRPLLSLSKDLALMAQGGAQRRLEA